MGQKDRAGAGTVHVTRITRLFVAIFFGLLCRGWQLLVTFRPLPPEITRLG